jgi:cellulose synthase/poly-beta-1,6-N-acetylglucosamine synthase-like glycosyltransferase
MPDMPTPPIVSVILTTRFRVDSLRRCLESLRQCRVPPGWVAEILVVDNGCSNETKTIVEAMSAEATPGQFHYLCEPRQGKTFAVNKATAVAKGTIIAFTDDDAVVSTDWLDRMIEEFTDHPGIALVAGKVAPLPGHEPLVAVTRVKNRTQLDGLSSLEGFVLGCNLAIRREVLEKVRGRDTRIGPGRGLACEDIDFTYRVLRSGYRGVFSPEPVVLHEPGQRDREREYLRGWGAFYMKFFLAGDMKVARQMKWRLLGVAKKLVSAQWRDALYQGWHLAIGASIMMIRMASTRLPYG